jgi:hypothetical protein
MQMLTGTLFNCSATAWRTEGAHLVSIFAGGVKAVNGGDQKQNGRNSKSDDRHYREPFGEVANTFGKCRRWWRTRLEKSRFSGMKVHREDSFRVLP